MQATLNKNVKYKNIELQLTAVLPSCGNKIQEN